MCDRFALFYVVLIFTCHFNAKIIEMVVKNEFTFTFNYVINIPAILCINGCLTFNTTLNALVEKNAAYKNDVV